MIVADASPLIMFARSGLLGALRAVVGEVLVPAAVWRECTEVATRPGAAALRQARRDGLLRLRASSWTGDALPALGPGELAAIALAMRLSCPLLIDERLGRAVAQRQGLRVTGSCAVLLRAKAMGLIPALRPVLLEWRAGGWYLSDALHQEVLRRAAEA